MASAATDGNEGVSGAANGARGTTGLDDFVARPPRASPTVAFDKALDNILKLPSHDLILAEDALLVVGALTIHAIS